ncbi:MAG TPA: PepSY domain-containing protein [Nitrospira sp.]|nr:PepSY domain-containing protein [Nitrospira sp.]
MSKAKNTAALVNACSVSIEQAVRVLLISISTGGTVVDAKLKEKNEQVVWRIKLLTAGGRVKVYIDGRSGTIVEAIREELPTGTDSLVIPPVRVAEHMRNLESTSV